MAKKQNEKKGASANKALTADILQALRPTAEQIIQNDGKVRDGERMSMDAALAAGKHLLEGKQELFNRKVKGKFQWWIEHECGLPYQRGYNYMRLTAAAVTNPEIKKLGLTEAYERLKLVTRGKKRVGEQSAKSATNPLEKALSVTGGDPKSATTIQSARVTTTTVPEHVTTRKLGTRQVRREHDVFVIEIESEWNLAMAEITADVENFTAILRDGGLLIRLVETPVATSVAEACNG